MRTAREVRGGARASAGCGAPRGFATWGEGARAPSPDTGGGTIARTRVVG